MTYKDKIISLFIVISFIVTTESCVEPIVPELNNDDSELKLVVDAKITDQEGPFRVRLTRSVKVNVMFYLDPVLDADVHIYDDKGNSFPLFGDKNGWYESSDKKLKGIPGNSYTLSIATADGMQYESSSVLMEEAAEIDSLYFEEVSRTRFENNKTFEENWLDILLDSHDPEGKIKYWWFEFEETWQVRMLTDYISVQHSPPDAPSNITKENISVSADKIVCWVTKPSKSILIESTVSSMENEIKRFPLRSLGPGEDKLHIRYSILVKQSSISPELYDFWKLLKDVNENSGGIYDKMPAQIYGNISCCDGKSKALGYFSALSVKTKRLFIDETQHNVETVSAYQGCYYYDFDQIPWVPKSYFGINTNNGRNVYCSADYCADCRSYGTNIKPAFWQ
jgi:hypothetical protein